MPNSALNEVRCASCNAFIYSEPSPVHPLCKPSCRNCSLTSPILATWQVPQARPRWQDVCEFVYYNKWRGAVCASTKGTAGFRITKGYDPRPAPDWVRKRSLRWQICSSHPLCSSRPNSGYATRWDWVLHWYFLVGLPLGQIAEEIDSTPNAVQLMVRRLLKRGDGFLTPKQSEGEPPDERPSEVAALRGAGLSWREIERKTGIPRSTASRLVSHKKRHINRDYMRGRAFL